MSQTGRECTGVPSMGYSNQAPELNTLCAA
jgi:hypothetical protein